MAASVFAVLTLAAASGFAQDLRGIPAAAACGPSAVQYQAKHESSERAVATPEAGKALVYVIQDVSAFGCLGGCITTRVGLDGKWVGANRHNSYFSFSVEPGEHHLCVNRQSHFQMLSQMIALAHFTAEAGKTYYFRTRTTSSQYQTYLDFTPIDSDQGKLYVAVDPLSVSHPKK
jgi:hypothetical protein